MYCGICGKLIEDGSRFCNACGNPIGTQTIVNANSYQTIVDPAANSRMRAMAEMNRMIEYYSPMQQQYDELDACKEKIAFFKNRRSYVFVKGLKSTDKFWILSGFSFGLMFVALIFNEILKEYKSIPRFRVYFYTYHVGVIPITAAVSFAVLGVVFIIAGRAKFRSNHRKMNDYKTSQLCLYEQRYAELANELEDHFLAYGYCETGSEYTNPKILNALSKYIYSGRAITIQEAINLLHLDAHNTKMELQAEIIAMNTVLAAHYARKAAFFSAASFFF